MWSPSDTKLFLLFFKSQEILLAWSQDAVALIMFWSRTFGRATEYEAQGHQRPLQITELPRLWFVPTFTNLIAKEPENQHQGNLPSKGRESDSCYQYWWIPRSSLKQITDGIAVIVQMLVQWLQSNAILCKSDVSGRFRDCLDVLLN